MPYVAVLCTDFFFTLVVLSGQRRILTRTCVEIGGWGGGRELGGHFQNTVLVGHNLWVPFLVLVYDVIGTKQMMLTVGIRDLLVSW
jgi:hypothetical protein